METARDRLLVRITPTYDWLSMCQGFLFGQQPIFTYQSSAFMDDPGTGLWVVKYTERVVRVFVALLLAVFSEYSLSYGPTDIIEFACEIGFAMEVLLVSRANVREVLNSSKWSMRRNSPRCQSSCVTASHGRSTIIPDGTNEDVITSYTTHGVDKRSTRRRLVCTQSLHKFYWTIWSVTVSTPWRR